MLCLTFPALTRQRAMRASEPHWANSCRASGAGGNDVRSLATARKLISSRAISPWTEVQGEAGRLEVCPLFAPVHSLEKTMARWRISFHESGVRLRR